MRNLPNVSVLRRILRKGFNKHLQELQTDSPAEQASAVLRTVSDIFNKRFTNAVMYFFIATVKSFNTANVIFFAKNNNVRLSSILPTSRAPDSIIKSSGEREREFLLSLLLSN